MHASTTFRTNIVILFLVAGIAGVSFAGGMLVERGSNDAIGAAPPKLVKGMFTPAKGLIEGDIDTGLYFRVWNVLQGKYLRKPVADKDLFYGSLEGMVASLGDPYTVFLRPSLAQRFVSDLKGTFFGVGAEIGIRNERLIVIAPLPETPAHRAGLKSGDTIVTIDSADTTGMSVEAAVDKIRGPKGTKVTLSILREGFEKPENFVIVRDEIVVKSVSVSHDGDISIVKMSQFGADTEQLFSKAIVELQKRKARGLIVDLRSNPGGFLNTAVRVVSEWFPSGPVVLEKFNNGVTEEYLREGKMRLKGVTPVVIVNGFSASASEIMAGALQDYGAATIVGERTFGKGSVQDVEQLSDGSAVKVTVAEWFTPKGRTIDKTGIAPDIEIKPTKDEDPLKDEVLRHAKEILRTKIR